MLASGFRNLVACKYNSFACPSRTSEAIRLLRLLR